MTPEFTAEQERERDERQRRFAAAAGLSIVKRLDWAEAIKPKPCQRCGRTETDHYLSLHEFEEDASV